MLEHRLFPDADARAFTPTASEGGTLAEESMGDWSWKPHRYVYLKDEDRYIYRVAVTGPRCGCTLAHPVGTPLRETQLIFSTTTQGDRNPMNYAKIAAALHALADAFLEGDDQPAKGKGKKAAAEQPAGTVATVTTPVQAPIQQPAPVVPTVTKDQLNKLVLKVAAVSRDKAMAILEKFGHKNTVTMPPEQFQAVYDAFEEELARIDAAAVQQQQASLV